MYHYRQVLVRMRQGESDRQIATTGLIGRRAAGMLRKRAEPLGWLDPSHSLPPDEELVGTLQPTKTTRTREQSSVHRYRELIARWWSEGIDGTTIYAALQRNHNYQGSYSSLSRYLRALAAKTPRVTNVLEFAPGEAAQVDFGKGPDITDVHTHEIFKTWVFVMVLAWSRHQYAELVRDQSVETWLGCHRRAFEHFNGVPSKIIIDNPKCAITKACYYDPQRIVISNGHSVSKAKYRMVTRKSLDCSSLQRADRASAWAYSRRAHRLEPTLQERGRPRTAQARDRISLNFRDAQRQKPVCR